MIKNERNIKKLNDDSTEKQNHMFTEWLKKKHEWNGSLTKNELKWIEKSQTCTSLLNLAPKIAVKC